MGRGRYREGAGGVHPSPPPDTTCGFLIQLVFCEKRKTLWFISDEVKHEARLKNLC